MGGRHYLVMELLAGQTLRERLDTGAVPFIEAVAILTQIAGALDALHARGIIHRDLKPSNAMLLPDGRVKVLDFGVARRSKSEDITLTQAGSLVGSPAYMSPEQVMGATATPASDVWALGVLAYELLQGSSPFGGSNIAAVLYRVTHEPPMSLSQFGQEVNEIVSKALDKNPAHRFTTAGDFVRALRTAGEAVPAPSKSTRATPPIPAPALASPAFSQHSARAEPAPVHSHSMRVMEAKERGRGVSPVVVAASVAFVAVASVGYLIWNKTQGASPSGKTASQFTQATSTRPATSTSGEPQGKASSNLTQRRLASGTRPSSKQPKPLRRVTGIPKQSALSTRVVGPVTSTATTALVATPAPKVAPSVAPSVLTPASTTSKINISFAPVSKPAPARYITPAPVVARAVVAPPPVFRPTPTVTPTSPEPRPTPSTKPIQPATPKSTASPAPRPSRTHERRKRHARRDHQRRATSGLAVHQKHFGASRRQSGTCFGAVSNNRSAQHLQPTLNAQTTK